MASSVFVLMSYVIFIYITCSIAHEHHGISDTDHYGSGKLHNADYDHDAFLGKGHGHDFDELRPEESKRRLAKMVDKIDTNNDNFIEFEELRVWIEKQRTAYMWDALDVVIKSEDTDGDGQISWPEYKHAYYGTFQSDDHIDKRLKIKIEKSKRKFEAADEDNDGKLSRDEYAYFRHPEESSLETLQEIAVDEVIDEMDKNEDRLVDMDEFLGQYVDEYSKAPEWVIEDRKHFQQSLDSDKSGYLDRNEMRKWVLPNRNDSRDEANHLIKEADLNGDDLLSVTEITDQYNLFVGSTATNHGKALRYEL